MRSRESTALSRPDRLWTRGTHIVNGFALDIAVSGLYGCVPRDGSASSEEGSEHSDGQSHSAS
jgi:hypothetical protein